MIYEKSLKTLEFDIIKEMLAEKAVCEAARKKLLNIAPIMDINEAEIKINETTMAKDIIERSGTPPLPVMEGLSLNLELAEKGVMLNAEQLSDVARFAVSAGRMKKYLKKSETYNNSVSFYGNSMYDMPELAEEIERSIRNGTVEDDATPHLKDLSRKIESGKSQIRAKLEGLLRKNPSYFSDGFIAKRGEHFTLPVKQEYKTKVDGSVIDRSQTGATYFIEPAVAAKLRSELSLLEIDRQNEIIRILYTLTNTVCDYAPSIKANIEALETLDYIFAKAKLSIDMKGNSPTLSPKRHMKIINGRHPLLNPKEVVPLNFETGISERKLLENDAEQNSHIRGIVITGPNTGGKTVALKTIGLLSVMAGSGLHIPADSGSIIPMNDYVLCDIGDGQSITENLSTFSSHVTTIIQILELAGRDSLVLVDELGSGTDPAEGMGIAIAVLEELKRKNSLFVATTHYPQIKDYATSSEGLINARMAFDKESLKPLYSLEIGEAGESCALFIAKRLGLPEHMLKKAYEAAYDGGFRANPQAEEKTSEYKELFRNAEEILPQDEKLGTANRNTLKTAPIVRDKKESKFNIGDSVRVYPEKQVGIIYALANASGEFGVQIKKKKMLIKHKRLKLMVAATELYPPDYDFSTVFESVEMRKGKKQMTKHHDPNLVIKYD